MNIDIEKFIQPPRKETLAANVAAQLKSLIFKQTLKAGDRLPAERKLAEMFGVSRAIVNQALLALKQSGFIETKLGSKGGAFIKYDLTKPIIIFMEDLQKKDGLTITHFGQVRNAIECEAIKTAAQVSTQNDIQELIDLNEEHLKPYSCERHAEINLAFHLKLAEISGNPLIKNLLKAIIELVFNYVGTTVSKDFIDVTYNDHIDIIEAIKRRDGIEAEKMLLRNLGRVTVKDV